MRTAIITGSDSGIGRATAVALAREGYAVGITWRSDEAGAQATADEARATGARAQVARLDLAEPERAAEALDELAERLDGELSVLVNNAGGGNSGPFLAMDLGSFAQTLTANVTGTVAVTQAAARRMVAAGTPGRIVTVTSIHEHQPLRTATDYCAAKGALGLVTKVLALELAEHGIRVNAVAPGEIATAMTGNEDADPASIERPMIPLGRPGDAREIAALVVALCGEAGGYVTGASFVADGGMALMGPEANRTAKG